MTHQHGNNTLTSADKTNHLQCIQSKICTKQFIAQSCIDANTFKISLSVSLIQFRWNFFSKSKNNYVPAMRWWLFDVLLNWPFSNTDRQTDGQTRRCLL